MRRRLIYHGPVLYNTLRLRYGMMFLQSNPFVTNMFVRCSESMTMKLRSKMFQATLKQDIAFFDESENSTGSLTSAISQKPQQVNSAAGMTTAAVVQSIITLLVGLLIAFVVSSAYYDSATRLSYNLYFAVRVEGGISRFGLCSAYHGSRLCSFQDHRNESKYT